MRYLLALAVLSLAGSARAATLAQVCNRFNDYSSITGCHAAARGLSTDEKALDVCNRFNDYSSISGCIGALAGREYAAEDVASCNRFNDYSSITGCLKVAGRVSRPARGGERCRDRVADALAECRRRSRGPAAVLACLENSFDI